MPAAATTTISVRGVVKDYKGLRPLRVARLDVVAGEIVALDGLDRAAAGVLTDLVTGTVLPDEGEVLIDGRPTTALSSHDDWLRFLDRFGIVNDRVVLLDSLSIAQNLAVPLTLDLDPIPSDARAAVERLARVVGLDERALDAPLGRASLQSIAAVRLGRALAHDPRVLLVEHPTVGFDADSSKRLAERLREIVGRGTCAALVTTGDRDFARMIAGRSLSLRPATGEVTEARGWRRWF